MPAAEQMHVCVCIMCLVVVAGQMGWTEAVRRKPFELKLKCDRCLPRYAQASNKTRQEKKTRWMVVFTRSVLQVRYGETLRRAYALASPEDAEEGGASFKEKRPPVWTGKSKL